MMSVTLKTCAVDYCEHPAKHRGWCSGHYQQVLKKGAIQGPLQLRRLPGAACSIKGCDKPVLSRGWCTGHYGQWRRTGAIQGPLKIQQPSPPCSVDGCETPNSAHGFCALHAGRLYRRGTVHDIAPPTDAERFWSHVDKDGPAPHDSEAEREEHGSCWVWKDHLTLGYGQFKGTQAHRWSWRQEYGPIPDGLVLDHFVCDRKNCVRPSHLRPTTSVRNVMRAYDPATHIYAGRDRCGAGHHYTAETTMVETYGGKTRRRCTICVERWRDNARRTRHLRQRSGSDFGSGPSEEVLASRTRMRHLGESYDLADLAPVEDEQRPVLRPDDVWTGVLFDV